MQSRHAVFTETPHQEINGDWLCNIQGSSSGKAIELVLAISYPDENSGVAVVTVINKNGGW